MAGEVRLSTGHVEKLRGYLHRADALLDRATEATADGPRFESLMRERAAVHTELAGYLDAVLAAAADDPS